MAQAGQTFKNRQRMIAEFKQKAEEKKWPNLRNSKQLSHDIVSSRVKNGQIDFFRFPLKKTKSLRHVREIEAEIQMKREYIKKLR